MNTEQRQYRARSFGLLWQSEIELEHFANSGFAEEHADIIVSKTALLSERNPIERINRGFVYSDGFRFEWNDIATFDVFDGNRVEYCHGPNWTGAFPWSFYSTVTALLLAWRGDLPFHGSAVSIYGHGVLICGESGAGKSSLTAALVAEGAYFISDDLSAVTRNKEGKGWNLIKGRPGLRLFPTVGRWFFGDDLKALPNDPRGKVLVVPACDESDTPIPLRHVVFLSSINDPISAIDQFLLLKRNLFRPNWLAKLPSLTAIRFAVRDIAMSAHIRVEPVIGETDEQSLRRRAKSIFNSVKKYRPKVSA